MTHCIWGHTHREPAPERRRDLVFDHAALLGFEAMRAEGEGPTSLDAFRAGLRIALDYVLSHDYRIGRTTLLRADQPDTTVEAPRFVTLAEEVGLRLRAAAPELYAALIDATAALTEASLRAGEGTSGPYTAEIFRAQAALAKAEGR